MQKKICRVCGNEMVYFHGEWICFEALKETIKKALEIKEKEVIK